MFATKGERIQKALLMGRGGAGKTSMRSIIFANFHAKDTFKMTPTIDINSNKFRFMGNLILNLWDCGGQNQFMEQYFESQKENIFKNVEVLIYVFDIKSKEEQKDILEFEKCIQNIGAFSENAKIFCLIHKMDLVPEEKRKEVFLAKKTEIMKIAEHLKVDCYRTSIWDESLYKAWSEIVNCLIPNMKILKTNLKEFATVTSADEVVLFEKSTFLVICEIALKDQKETDRFEKISNIIKQFKLCIMMTSYPNFQSMTVRNGQFRAIIAEFTKSTYILLIISDQDVEDEVIVLNIAAAKPHFEALLSSSFQ